MSSTETASERVVSIDALRGFDMFWIIGGDTFFGVFFAWGGWTISPVLHEQLVHVEWEGFRFYDLIYPLFMFLVGCVLPYSLEKYRDRPAQAYWRVIRRTLLLVLLGMIANGLLQFDWPNMRWSGVLQRIGICYGAAALIYLCTRPRTQWLIAAAILLGYWALLVWVPVPGRTGGVFSMQWNLAAYLDRLLLPGKILEPYYGWGDNEGILSTLPAIVTTMLGAQAGLWLKSERGPWSKVGGLVVAGLICLAVGWTWGIVFPIIKNIWTSSFVLFAAGWSLLLLALFYAVIDVWRFRKWAFVFTVIGMNAITIYFMRYWVDFDEIAAFFLGGTARLCGDFGPVLLAAGVLVIEWLWLWFLYRHKVFLRV
jgi:predicted acyltransferase